MTDTFGKDEIVVKSNVESIKKECLPYITEITDMTSLSSELEKFIDEINDYFKNCSWSFWISLNTQRI